MSLWTKKFMGPLTEKISKFRLLIELDNESGCPQMRETWHHVLEHSHHEMATMIMPMLDKNKLKRH